MTETLALVTIMLKVPVELTTELTMGHNNKLHCRIHYWQQQEKDTKGVGFKGAVLLKLAIENTNYCKTLCLTLMQRLSYLLYFQQSKFNETIGAFKPFVFQNVPLVYDGDDDMCCRNAPTMRARSWTYSVGE